MRKEEKYYFFGVGVGLIIGLALGVGYMMAYYNYNPFYENDIILDCEEEAMLFEENRTQNVAKATVCYEEYPELFYRVMIEDLQDQLQQVRDILIQG